MGKLSDSTQPLHRDPDAKTSIAAAKKTVTAITQTKRNVLSVFESNLGGLTDEELHKLCCEAFGNKAESSYRKRRSELSARHFLRLTGSKRRNAMGNDQAVWTITPEGLAEHRKPR